MIAVRRWESSWFFSLCISSVHFKFSAYLEKKKFFKLEKRIDFFFSETCFFSVFEFENESVSCLVMSDSLRLHGLQPARLLCPWNSLGKNTGVGSLSLLQGLFPTQGSNLHLLHGGQILYHLSHQGSPTPQNFFGLGK